MNHLFRVLCVALTCVCFCHPAAAERPVQWAQPIAAAGVPNLHQIAPGLYRSAQPTADGMQRLKGMGIRTVISFRAYHDDKEALAGTGIRAVRIPINTWDIRDSQVVATLKALKQKGDGPFLIHCQHGADRTGLMSAMYRIVVQGWDKRRAVDEMTQGGYGYHAIWKNIPHYIETVDIDEIRRQVDNGSPAPAASRRGAETRGALRPPG
jgi:protein tyrosine/serine phosphatase